jgi:RNA polymerase sigma-70 factor, ECF subfamily
MTSDGSFERAYAQYLPAVSSYLSRRVEHRFVEDLAADVFAVAWTKRESVAAGEELPWLYRIAANLVANHRRRQAAGVSVLHLLRMPDSAPSAEDIVIADESLAAAWRRLKGRDREVLALAVLEDLPIASIATSLGISANAVSIRLHRAKKNLAGFLDDGERSEPHPT